MKPNEKMELFQKLNTEKVTDAETFYETLEKCDALKTNYHDYMTTAPIDCDKELLRLPRADYDLCCALLTMLLREDHFCNGSFARRQSMGQVKPIVEQIIHLLESQNAPTITSFSEKAIESLNGFYVYALIDPRNEKVFYIGKGTGNRVFSHEIESGKSRESEKKKIQQIREIENSGYSVKRLIVNWGLSENEAFVAEATLINLLNRMPDIQLTNEVSGHHVHDSLTTEEFELQYGAVPLEKEDIKQNQLYGIELRDDMFSIATTNMILRGDGKSNLLCQDFLKQSVSKLRDKHFTVGLMNPPYSQGKKKETAHLTELKFICHLLDSLDDGARCAVIVPQSTMVGKTKEDKKDKKYILEHHTLEGVITLNPQTFYSVGVNPVSAIFTAHKPHDQYAKFIDFKDDGYEVFPHIGLLPTVRAAERKKLLLECWLKGRPAPVSFMVQSTVEPNDEWLHSFYYFNEEIPTDKDFEEAMADYLTFEFSMITHGRGYLFEGKEGNV